jgi:hypothetical protein
MANTSATWFREEVRSAIRFLREKQVSTIVVYRLLIKRFMMMAQRGCSMSEYCAEVKSGQNNVHDDDRSASGHVINDGCQHSTSAGNYFGKPTTISRCIR